MLSVGGTFGDQPSAPGGSISAAQAAQAVQVALARPPSADAPTPAEVSVLAYADRARTTIPGTVAQVPADESVYLVHVLAPMPAAVLPHPLGTSHEEDRPSYLAAFDARTGLVLATTPGPAA